MALYNTNKLNDPRKETHTERYSQSRDEQAERGDTAKGHPIFQPDNELILKKGVVQSHFLSFLCCFELVPGVSLCNYHFNTWVLYV